MASTSGAAVYMHACKCSSFPERLTYTPVKLAHAWMQIAEKKLVVAGAIADPVDGGLLIFQGVTKEEVTFCPGHYLGLLLTTHHLRWCGVFLVNRTA